MPDILVRNIDEGLIETLELKAKLKGRSLQQELHAILTASSNLTPDEKVGLADRIRSQCPPLPGFDVRAAIRYGRDDEHD
jgi:hypothetical protein